MKYNKWRKWVVALGLTIVLINGLNGRIIRPLFDQGDRGQRIQLNPNIIWFYFADPSPPPAPASTPPYTSLSTLNIGRRYHREVEKPVVIINNNNNGKKIMEAIKAKEEERKRKQREEEERKKREEEELKKKQEKEERKQKEKKKKEDKKKKKKEKKEKKEQKRKQKVQAEQARQKAAEKARVKTGQVQTQQHAVQETERQPMLQEEQPPQQAADEAEKETRAQEEQERQREAEEAERAQNGDAEEENPLNQEKGEEIEEEAFEKVEETYLEIDGVQFAQGIAHIESMFDGQMAPDMDIFDDMMDTSLEEEKEQGGAQSITESEAIIANNYLITSYQYMNAVYNIAIEVGCVTKFAYNEFNYDDKINEALNLKGINVDPSTGKITFALNDNREKILIKSDLNSMQNYVGQKRIEETINLTPADEHLPIVEPDKVPIWGTQGQAAETVRSIVSTVLDFIPLFGTSKAITELIWGRDEIAGQDVGRIVAASGLLLTAIPGAKTLVKVIADAPRAVVIGAEATKKLVTSLIRAIPGKATGGNALPLIKEGDVWLRGTQGNAGKVPQQIADKLRGRSFKNWDDFRRNFWKEVAEDPVLSKGFSQKDISAMKIRGVAPVVTSEQQVGKLNAYILHHEQPIYKGGSVYNIDNIKIVTPRYHKEALEFRYHYNKQ